MVQHALIACVGLVTVSLQRDKHHPPAIVVGTVSKWLEYLVLMLLLDVVQLMFSVDELVNED